MNLPRDTEPVGPNPSALDDWVTREHGPKDPGDQLDEDVFPATPAGDPWYHQPLPTVANPAELPNGAPSYPVSPRTAN